MHHHADLSAIPGQSGSPFRVAEGAGECGEGERSLFEPLGKDLRACGRNPTSIVSVG
jgi:hypothetical protein